MPESENALIVFAKVPEPNKVKTRLTTLVSPEWAANLYEAFLMDAIDLYRTFPVDVRLYFTDMKEKVPEKFAPAGVALFTQKGRGLGNRMATAFAETFVQGYERAVIIGTDHPTLPVSFVEEAFRQIEDPYSITIGPSEDGGYYLLGMNEFYPQLFRDMTYSHDQVFNETVSRAGQTSASLNVLPVWYDVDTPDTLQKLLLDLEDCEQDLIHTRKTIAEMKEHYPALIV